MGGLARARIETVYNWDHVIDQLDRLYRRLSPNRSDTGSEPREATDGDSQPPRSCHRLLEADDGSQKSCEALASYRDPDEPLSPGINVWRTDSDARPYRVVHGRDSVLSVRGGSSDRGRSGVRRDRGRHPRPVREAITRTCSGFPARDPWSCLSTRMLRLRRSGARSTSPPPSAPSCPGRCSRCTTPSNRSCPAP